MSDQQTAAAVNLGENVSIPRPTQFAVVIQGAIASYPGGGGPGIQLAAWVSNDINRYFNLPAGEIPSVPLQPPHDREVSGVGAARLTNLGAAVQAGLDKWDAGHEPIGPTQADYVANAVIEWLQTSY